MAGIIPNSYVPAEGDPAAPVWIIGESPGFDETQELRPFIGRAGRILNVALGRAGLTREACPNSDLYVTNLCSHRPIKDKFENLRETKELAESLDNLTKLLTIHKPRIIIGLGNEPLKFFTGNHGITRWRGSVLQTKSGHKYFASLHPSYISRQPKYYPIFDFDIQKAIRESVTSDITYPEATFVIAKDELAITYWTKRILELKHVTCDIETSKGIPDIHCIGFGISSKLAVCFPYSNNVTTQESIRTILSSEVNKIFHNGIFDVSVLKFWGFEVSNYTDDTIIQAHILEPELPASLAHLSTIYTRWPYYKDEGKGEFTEDTKAWSSKRSASELYEYNCKDCVVTYEVFEGQRDDLDKANLMGLYKHEMECQQAAIDMSFVGLYRDEERYDQLKQILEDKYLELKDNLSKMLKDVSINTRSPAQVKIVLYDYLKLPPRKSRATGKLTTDEDALVSLMTYVKGHIAGLKKYDTIMKWQIKLVVLKLIIDIKGIEKLLSSYFNVTLHEGRVKTLYKVHGTETGRWAATKFIDGSGLNAQTIPRGYIKS